MQQAVIGIILILYKVVILAQNEPTNHFEGYYLAQQKYPNKLSNVDWFPDDYEIQGVTNDGKNWYFTVVDQDKTQGIIWKIPKDIPLANNVSGKQGVIKKNYSDNDLALIRSLGCWHYGDLDHFKYKNVDLLFVPINTNPARIIVFDAKDLKYINYGLLDSRVSPGWCAINVDSMLYTSPNDIGSLVRYRIKWDDVFTNKHNFFVYDESISIRVSNNDKVTMTNLQGGEFTPSGEMLYLVSGRGKCIEGAEWTNLDGVHAIQASNWRKINQSVKNSDVKTNFSYDYDPTCDGCFFGPFPTGAGTETPEGLTIWDLEDGSAPNIYGSLHVLVDKYTYGGADCDDNITFHHFSSTLFVNKNKSGGGLLGTKTNPFNTIMQAISYYPIWNGSKVIINSGNYSENIIFNKKIMIKSDNGSVVIGKK